MLIRGVAVTSGQTATTSTTPAHVDVSLLDITDPFQAYGTGQPLGYDQWKNFYNRAKVVGTKVTFTVHNAGSVAIVFGLNRVPEGEAAAPTPWEYTAEIPGTKYRILSPEMDHGTLVMKSSTKKFFKIKDIKDTEEIACDLSTDAGPTRDSDISCFFALHNGTTSTNVDWIVKVEYLVLLDKPNVPARSVDA